MKLSFLCVKCAGKLTSMQVEVNDEGIYSLTCPYGHEAVHTLSLAKFEILFEMAVIAFVDDYTREAVVNLAASVEEFQRFFVEMVLIRQKLYEDGGYDEVKRFWKVANRAEPQLGAFALAHLLELKQAPQFPDDRWIKFRNDVVHKGKIPTSASTLEHGDRVVAFMVPLYLRFRDGFEPLIAAGMKAVENLKPEYSGEPQVTVSPRSAFRSTFGSDPPSIEAAIELVRRSGASGNRVDCSCT